MVTHAAPPEPDPLPKLIHQANTEAAAGDAVALYDTLGQISQHIGQANDAELKDIGNLQTALVGMLKPATKPAAVPEAKPEAKPTQPPPVASPAPAPAPAPAAMPAQQDPVRAQDLYERGIERERSGDFDSARRLYRVAADEGLADAAIALGHLYDPAYLSHAHVFGGISPDVAEARRWYQRAVTLGSPEGTTLMQKLPK